MAPALEMGLACLSRELSTTAGKKTSQNSIFNEFGMPSDIQETRCGYWDA